MRKSNNSFFIRLDLLYHFCKGQKSIRNTEKCVGQKTISVPPRGEYQKSEMTRLRPEKFGKVWYRYEENRSRTEGGVQIHTYIHTYIPTYLLSALYIRYIYIYILVIKPVLRTKYW